MNVLVLGMIAGLLTARVCAAEILFAEDFSKVEPGPLPDDYLVLDGLFEVREDGGNRFAELPGAPLESFGFLFGSNQPSGVEATATIFGTKSGRKFPTFGLGLNGASGYRLQVAPAKNAVELLRGDLVVATAPYAWESGTWTHLRLALRKTGESTFRLEGTVWAASAEAPTEPLLTFDETRVQPAGKASVWGMPFAGTPIRFDNLAVRRLPAP